MSLGHSSLRSQLIVWLLIPILVLWIVVGFLVCYVVGNFSNKIHDDKLVNSAKSLISRVHLEKGNATVNLPQDVIDVFETNSSDKFYFQILSDDGKVLAGNGALPKKHAAEIGKELEISNSAVGDIPIRLAILRVNLGSADAIRTFIIQAAETLNGRRSAVKSILFNVGLIQLATIILGALIVWFVIGRSLAPFDRMRAALVGRSSRELEPLRIGLVPREVQPLIVAINDLLKRISAELEVQQRFITNAAHQLRTPLAGLRTQLDFALRQRTLEDIQPYLEQAGASTDRLTRLIHQLLAMARIEPGGLSQEHEQVVDIADLSADLTRDFVAQALAKNIDLGFEGKERGVFVLGRPFSLREMISNIIENALRYTQAGGRVTVRLSSAETVKLAVEDNGPGIPVDERNNVFERFYRVLRSNSVADGSGLGLSIVDEVARAHKATVEIRDGSAGTGTIVEVTFPLRQKLAIANAAERDIRRHLGS